MSKGSVIALESYEKHSFFRFFLIFTVAALALFLTLSLLYYYKERNRYFQEQKIENKLAFAECQHLNKLFPDRAPCQMKPITIDKELSLIYRDIAVALLIWLIMMLPLGYYLARLSLRPIRQSVETMDSFINGIVHDINTPLSIIRLNAQSTLKHLYDEKLIAKHERIMQGVDHIEALEEQMLFMLKIRHYRLQYTSFDLYELLQQRLSYWNDVRHTVTLTLVAESTPIHADKDALIRLLDNIVGNAIKYSPSNATVEITCKSSQLTIKDNGPGIQNPHEVFEKYYRESTESKGLGLGLYIVKEIASLHRLTIHIDSCINEGTTFRIPLEPILLLHKHPTRR